MNRSALEIELLKHGSVVDCFTSQRPEARPEFTAYVVLRGRLDAPALVRHLADGLGATPSIDFIPVSRLPLTSDGVVDVDALEHVRETREQVSAAWELELNALPGVEHAAVVLEDQEPAVPPLHVADLLPEWNVLAVEQSPSGSAEGEVPPETPAASLVPSMAEGPDLVLPADAPATLVEALERTIRLHPGHGIVYIRADGTERVQPYPELMEEALRLLSGLRELQLPPQAKVIFQFDDNDDYIPAFWACLLGGFVPVPIAVAPVFEPGNSMVERLVQAWLRLDSPLVLTTESIAGKLHPLYQSLKLDGFRSATIESLRTHPPATSLNECQPDDLAVLLLTSGSTGIPKGVMLTHRNILTNVSASAQVNDFGSDDISLNWLRLDHVGSLVRCSIRDIYVGSTQVHAPAELVLESPTRLLDWIEQYAVTFAWAPNFALGLINKQLQANTHKQWNLSSLRSMLSVAEAIIPKTAQTFVRLLAPSGFQPSAMHAAWGMSETCAAVTFSHNYLERLPSEDYPYVEVGAPTAGFEIRIVDKLDQIVSEGTVGRLQIKGPMVLSGYYESPELNASEFTSVGWFKTGDLGYMKEGRLTVNGREKDIIIINGLNHSCSEIEAIVEEVDGVLPSYTAACGLRQAGQDTDQLLVFFCGQAADPDALKALLKNIQSALSRKLGIQASHLLPVESTEIPKTSAGKIQRLKLKELFEARAFDDRIKTIDRLLENQRTLPDWFFKPCWQRQQAVLLQSLPSSSQVLVFCDGSGFGEALADALGIQGHHCITVEPSDGFSKPGNTHFTIAPDHPDDYQKLIADAYPSRLPDVIVHCWLYQPSVNAIASTGDLDAVQSIGACSLLHLAQTLAQCASDDQPLLRLQVVSSYGQLVDGVDTVLDYAKSPILGLIKTIPRELAWLDCRHLDLEFGHREENMDAVLEELRVPQVEREVARRKGARFVPRIAPFDWERQTPTPLPFSKDGFYLITGGLGGVGFELAQYLLQHQNANVLLVGRSSLEPSSSSSQVEPRRQRLETLQALGGQVAYVVADVDDRPALERWVGEFSQRWQMPLGGIVHLAGVAPERLIVDETWESMSAALRAKVAGTWVLHQLVKDRPDCLFISMSSVISLVGGATVGAYSASNMFLNHFQQHTRLTGHSQHYCFCSSTWSQIGVNQGYAGQQARQAQGQVAMSASGGLQSVLVGLRYRVNDLVFGLDRKKPAVQRMCRDVALWNQQPVAYLQSTLGDQELQRLRRPTRARIERVEQLPLGPDGLVDRVSLLGLANARNVQGEPQTPLEKKLADIWQSVLGLSSVGREDNFFELGGTSVQAARLFIEIEQATGMMLPLASLFQAPTIAQLARLTEQGESDPSLWSSLVPIREEGDRSPLFFIHAGFGDVVGFEIFARYLDRGWPIYALRPEDLGGHCEPLWTIEEMAAHYIEEIQRRFPEGPYFLIGHCTGGTVAYEMAQQLKAQGHEIGFLGMNDTSYPAYKSYLRSRFQYYDHPPCYKSGRFDVSFLVSSLIYRMRPYQRAAAVIRHLSAFRKDKRAFLKNMFAFNGNRSARKEQTGQEPEANLDPSAAELSKAYIDERFFESFMRADQRYVPKPYSGGIDFFLATRNTYVAAAKPYSLRAFRQNVSVRPGDPLHYGWDKLVGGGFRILPVEIRHEDMLLEPAIQQLCEKLNTALRDAEKPD